MTKETSDAGATFGGRLRWLRDAYGLSLAEFGKVVSLGRSYLSKLENGVNRSVSAHVLEVICIRFHTHREWLLEGKGEPFTSEAANLAAKRGEILELEKRPTVEDFEELGDRGLPLMIAVLEIGRSMAEGQFSIMSLAEFLDSHVHKIKSPVQQEMAVILTSELAAQLRKHAATHSFLNEPIETPCSGLAEAGKMMGSHMNKMAALKKVEVEIPVTNRAKRGPKK